MAGEPVLRAVAPALTMPEAETALVRATCAGAGVVLEYGSGGTTLIAAELARTAVLSVESDRAWVLRMRAWFKDHPAPVPVTLHHAAIGAVKRWGFPKDATKTDRWPGYALSIWDHPDFQHPDVVLIDGRFRLACLLTTLFRITRPTRVLCDDYAKRPAYHAFERLAGAPEMTGRMAAFTLTPQPMPPDQMGWIIPAFTNPA